MYLRDEEYIDEQGVKRIKKLFGIVENGQEIITHIVDQLQEQLEPQISLTEQRELDKEELLIDALIGQQQIQLSLETGGDSV